MLLYLLVLGMLLELRQALDLVKMLPLLLSLENLHLDLWNQAKVTSESTYPRDEEFFVGTSFSCSLLPWD